MTSPTCIKAICLEEKLNLSEINRNYFIKMLPTSPAQAYTVLNYFAMARSTLIVTASRDASL